jgi:hypothetical protein
VSGVPTIDLHFSVVDLISSSNLVIKSIIGLLFAAILLKRIKSV